MDMLEKLVYLLEVCYLRTIYLVRTLSFFAFYCLLASFPLRQELTERWKEYTQKEKLRVCVGSWNVNGGKHIRSIALKNHSMNDWLLDAPAGKRDVAVSKRL